MSWPIVQIEGYEVAWMLDKPRALISDTDMWHRGRAALPRVICETSFGKEPNGGSTSVVFNTSSGKFLSLPSTALNLSRLMK